MIILKGAILIILKGVILIILKEAILIILKGAILIIPPIRITQVQVLLHQLLGKKFLLLLA